MMKFKCTFTGRNKGAIGIFYTHTVVVWNDTEDHEQIRLKLYDTHEHITNLKIERINDQ